MLFETLSDSSGVDHVSLFFDTLEVETAEKLIGKLSAFKDIGFVELMRSEHIKKIEGKLFEMRVPIKGDHYRFLGTTRGVHSLWSMHLKRKQIS